MNTGNRIPLSRMCIIVILASVVSVFGQNLNVIPDLLRPYVNEFPELQSLNILGNVSDILFTNARQEASINWGDFQYRQEYDFIIVGSGPAGCVLANRLSRNPNWTVLLIEAGPPESPAQKIPLATSFGVSSSSYVRHYYFERNSGACLNIVDKECPFHAGVALGGSSVVNNCLYSRGSAEDFDKWAELGNEGWGYEDVLPYIEKVERTKRWDPTDDESDEKPFRDGLLNIEQPQFRTGLLPMYLKAGKELGLDLIDYSAKRKVGIGIAKGTTHEGKRVSAATAYLQPIHKKRPNLHIMTSSRATRILIDKDSRSAYGVQYISDGVESLLRAKKEVILSAGAIGSAHLLMLSGVGPKHILERVNVSVVADLPVGQSFKTNIAVHAPHFLVNTTTQSIHIKRISLNSILQFAAGKGVLTSLTGTEAIAYFNTPDQELSSNQPTVELQFVSAGMPSDLGMGFRKVAQIKQSVYEELFKPLENPGTDIWSAIVMSLHSTSNGSMKLVDNDINTDPILKYPFFEDPRDMQKIVHGIKTAIRFAETNTFRSIGARLYDMPLPNCVHYYRKGQDKYWECYVRHMTIVTPEMVSSNKMGPETDPEAVVDSEMRVRGIRNLRVADTSIIPTTISGQLQGVSYVIGEKLAAILRNTWTTSSRQRRPLEDAE